MQKKLDFKFNRQKVYYLEDKGSPEAVVDHLAKGNIIALDMGDAYGFVFNPHIENLAYYLTVLRGREKNQYYSVIASYDYLCQNVIDKNRVNLDFFKLNDKICSEMMVRVPYASLAVNAIGNGIDRSIQSFSFDGSNHLLRELREMWIGRGLTYMAGASCNLHLEPTITLAEEAEKFCWALNCLAEATNLPVEFIVVHLKHKHSPARAGSYPIVSFMNKDQIEIVRLANKNDKEKTDLLKDKIEKDCNFSTSIVYRLE